MLTCTEASTVTVLEPGDLGWDAARRAFDLAVDQQPALAGIPLDDRDVAAAVRIAADRGLRVVAQSQGHGAASAGRLDDAMLLRTTALAGVEITSAPTVPASGPAPAGPTSSTARR